MNNYNNRSRLRRKLEKQSKEQNALFIVGILVIFFLIFKYGIFAVTGIGSTILKINEIKTPNTNSTTNQGNVSLTPVLDPLPTATNSANLKISGNSLGEKGKIELFINDNSVAETSIDDNNEFNFKNIALSEGNNLIKVRTNVDKDKFSDFSKEYSVSYKKGEPKLDITFPLDGTNFSKNNDQEINIEGKTDPENKVYINGFWAIVDGNGDFSYFMKLNNGDNNISVEAIDPAGNNTKKEIKVTYNP